MRRAILLFGCALAGCSGPGFAPAEYVEGLRVLGARAEPAEVGPGESTRVEALIVDTLGRSVSAEWKLCRIDRAGTMATIATACAAPETGPVLVPLGSGAAVDVTVPGDLDGMRLGVPDFTLGVYLPLVLRARVAGADPVIAIFRLRLPASVVDPRLPALPPNQNPKLARVDQRRGEGTPTTVAEGEVLQVAPGERIRLSARYAEGSAEMYLALRGTTTMPKIEPATELPNFAWFTSGGEISPGNTGNEVETTLTAPMNGAFNVWVVARDERGGSDWRQLSLVVK